MKFLIIICLLMTALQANDLTWKDHWKDNCDDSCKALGTQILANIAS